MSGLLLALLDEPAATPPRPRAAVEGPASPALGGFRPQPLTDRLHVQATPRAPAALRRGVRVVLHRWGLLSLADGANLAVTELAGELLRLRPPALTVRLRTLDGAGVRLDAHPSTAAPGPGTPPEQARPGSGLDLVRAFAARAGRYTAPDGVPHLWCELTSPG